MLGTGGAQVLVHALRALTRYDRDNEYLLYHQGLGRLALRYPRLAAPSALWADLISKNTWLPAWSRIKGVEALLYFLPPCSMLERHLPQLCHILDVPEPTENTRFKDRFYNQFFIGGSARHATRILTISEFSKQRIQDFLGVDPSRISVLYPCLDLDLFCPAGPPPTLPSYVDASKGYLLGVCSSLHPRKNPGAYLRIYAALPEELRNLHPLVMAGAARSLADLRPFVEDEVLRKVEGRLYFPGRVSDAELAALYRQCRAVLFPSIYEGFGLPVSEAVACGAPVVGTDLAVLREAGGDALVAHPAEDISAFAASLVRLLRDAPWRNELRDKGLAWSRRFSYEKYALRFREILSEVAAGSS